MSTFVDDCRREWKRLGVPDLIADEMAIDLTADLQEAQAEGVEPEQILGVGASDPQRFAADWAQARGVIADQPKTSRRRPWLIVAGAAAVVVVAGAAAAVALVAVGSHSTAPNTVQQPRVTAASVPDFVGESVADATAQARDVGLRVEVVMVRPSSKRAGTVISQTPAAGMTVPREATLRLRVAGEPSAPTKTQP